MNKAVEIITVGRVLVARDENGSLWRMDLREPDPQMSDAVWPHKKPEWEEIRLPGAAGIKSPSESLHEWEKAVEDHWKVRRMMEEKARGGVE